mgnify:CR=1 FL=1
MEYYLVVDSLRSDVVVDHILKVFMFEEDEDCAHSDLHDGATEQEPLPQERQVNPIF